MVTTEPFLSCLPRFPLNLHLVSCIGPVKVPEFGTASDGSVTPPVTPPVNQYIRRLLELLDRRGALGNADIRIIFELKDRRRLRETYIKPALAADLIEMTIPEKPNSRLLLYHEVLFDFYSEV